MRFSLVYLVLNEPFYLSSHGQQKSIPGYLKKLGPQSYCINEIWVTQTELHFDTQLMRGL